MRSKKYYHTLYLEISQLFFKSCLSETFQQSLALSNDTLIILSSIKKNATEARRICSSLGGSLAVFNNYDKEKVYEVLDETYVKGKEFHEKQMAVIVSILFIGSWVLCCSLFVLSDELFSFICSNLINFDSLIIVFRIICHLHASDYVGIEACTSSKLQ